MLASGPQTMHLTHCLWKGLQPLGVRRSGCQQKMFVVVAFDFRLQLLHDVAMPQELHVRPGWDQVITYHKTCEMTYTRHALVSGVRAAGACRLEPRSLGAVTERLRRCQRVSESANPPPTHTRDAAYCSMRARPSGEKRLYRMKPIRVSPRAMASVYLLSVYGMLRQVLAVRLRGFGLAAVATVHAACTERKASLETLPERPHKRFDGKHELRQRYGDGARQHHEVRPAPLDYVKTIAADTRHKNTKRGPNDGKGRQSPAQMVPRSGEKVHR